MPRLKGHLGDFKPDSIVSDSNLVQLIVALRLFLPQLGLTLSTREAVELRNNLIPLGITKMSAESSTVVGGYATNKGVGQFDTADNRTVAEIKDLLIEAGYQPILKDWHSLVGLA
jgi:2-iminoacetate synthase